MAPDTCQCFQFPNSFRDFREGGGRPKYQKENGDPVSTGWTGFDCSTPICVQAEKFVFNTFKYKPGKENSPDKDDLNPKYGIFGGHGGDVLLTCVDLGGNELPRCPQFDDKVTSNTGQSFQTGCGYDPYDTGRSSPLHTPTPSPPYRNIYIYIYI